MMMEPLVVTAHLAQGYARADDWSPSLDGILAYWALRETLGEEAFVLGSVGQQLLTEADIPIEREEWNGTHWFRASSPQDALMCVFERHIHRRFDDQHERYLRDGIRSVMTSAGPYKAYRNRHMMRLTPWVRWHAIGNAAEIERLLRRCTNIGQGVSRGYGRVLRWEVEPGGDAHTARFNRPLPVEFARAHGVIGNDNTGTRMVMRYGIRPPGRAPDRQMECVMPWDR